MKTLKYGVEIDIHPGESNEYGMHKYCWRLLEDGQVVDSGSHFVAAQMVRGLDTALYYKTVRAAQEMGE